jgi:hypothetical protein
VIPHDDGAFGWTYLGLILHEMDDRLQALREARRIARSGVAVLEWSFHQARCGPLLAHRLKPEEVAGLAQDAGFSRIETLTLSYLVLHHLVEGSGCKEGE